MLVRVISALAWCVVFIPVIIFSDTWAFPGFIAAVSLFSAYEMLRCIGVHKKHYLTVPICLYSGAAPIVLRLSKMYPEIDVTLYFLAGAVLLIMCLMALAIFSKGKFKLDDAAMITMTMFYIIGGYVSLIFLRDIADGGKYIYLFVFFGAWFTDIFAYFTGKLFGKHKLIPEISPKKTVEGSVGGIIFCIISYLVYGFVLQHFYSLNINYLALAFIGLIISVVSQIGDLSLSQIKRKYGIKDFGNVMPGHGGALDRFDSVLAVALTFVIAYGVLSAFGVNIIEVL